MTQQSRTTRVVDTRRAPRTTARTTLVVKVRALPPPPPPAIECIRTRAAGSPTEVPPRIVWDRHQLPQGSSAHCLEEALGESKDLPQRERQRAHGPNPRRA